MTYYTVDILWLELRYLIAFLVYYWISYKTGIVENLLKIAFSKLLTKSAKLEVEVSYVKYSLYEGYFQLYDISIYSPPDPIWKIDKMIEVQCVELRLNILQTIYWVIASYGKVFKLHNIHVIGMIMHVEAWEDPLSGDQFINTDLIGLDTEFEYYAPIYDSELIINNLDPKSLQLKTDINPTNTRKLRIPASHLRASESTDKVSSMTAMVTGVAIHAVSSATNFVTNLYDNGINLSHIQDSLHSAATEVVSEVKYVAQNGLFHTAKTRLNQVYKSARRSLGRTMKQKFCELHASLTRPEPIPKSHDIRIYGDKLHIRNTTVHFRNALPVPLRHLEKKKPLVVDYFYVLLHDPSNRIPKSISTHMMSSTTNTIITQVSATNLCDEMSSQTLPHTNTVNILSNSPPGLTHNKSNDDNNNIGSKDFIETDADSMCNRMDDDDSSSIRFHQIIDGIDMTSIDHITHHPLEHPLDNSTDTPPGETRSRSMTEASSSYGDSTWVDVNTLSTASATTSTNSSSGDILIHTHSMQLPTTSIVTSNHETIGPTVSTTTTTADSSIHLSPLDTSPYTYDVNNRSNNLSQDNLILSPDNAINGYAVTPHDANDTWRITNDDDIPTSNYPTNITHSNIIHAMKDHHDPSLISDKFGSTNSTTTGICTTTTTTATDYDLEFNINNGIYTKILSYRFEQGLIMNLLKANTGRLLYDAFLNWSDPPVLSSSRATSTTSLNRLPNKLKSSQSDTDDYQRSTGRRPYSQFNTDMEYDYDNSIQALGDSSIDDEDLDSTIVTTHVRGDAIQREYPQDNDIINDDNDDDADVIEEEEEEEEGEDDPLIEEIPIFFDIHDKYTNR